MRSLNTALLYAGALLSHQVLAKDDSTTDTAGPTQPTVTFSNTDEMAFFTGTKTEEVEKHTGPPTGPYSKYTSRITLGDPSDETITGSFTFTEGLSATETLSSAETPVANATDTTDKPEPTNTQPCNNYVDLCTRKYSNITNVGCHNSPFVRPGNTGSNQELPVKAQLDDGVRFLQAQIQWPVNGTVPHFCHTSCDLLDAGPITDWLGEVTDWVSKHPYDVVTILLGNGNYSKPSLYEPYLRESGIVKYAYEAPYLPMTRDDWPTLENLILRGKRVIMFLDYNADQTQFPWLLDQFAHVWETPFDPVDREFPCDVQRPPDLKPETARNRLTLMNHNLNVEFNVFDTSLLVPAVSLLNETNNATGYGSLGAAARKCQSQWGHPPTYLNVDYYNYGDPPGSVFEVAAQMNNVTYKWDCCGELSSAPGLIQPFSPMALVPAMVAALMLLM
ncbi:hypothetical protein ACO1O0_002272 [Amphichorda felina]